MSLVVSVNGATYTTRKIIGSDLEQTDNTQLSALHLPLHPHGGYSGATTVADALDYLLALYNTTAGPPGPGISQVQSATDANGNPAIKLFWDNNANSQLITLPKGTKGDPGTVGAPGTTGTSLQNITIVNPAPNTADPYKLRFTLSDATFTEIALPEAPRGRGIDRIQTITTATGGTQLEVKYTYTRHGEVDTDIINLPAGDRISHFTVDTTVDPMSLTMHYYRNGVLLPSNPVLLPVPRTLAELFDIEYAKDSTGVTLPLVDKQTLVYDATSQKWINSKIEVEALTAPTTDSTGASTQGYVATVNASGQIEWQPQTGAGSLAWGMGAFGQFSFAPGTLPPGVMLMMAPPNPPNGWLPCDGRTVAQATYLSLFNAIGHTYGTPGNPSADFVLPSIPALTTATGKFVSYYIKY